MSIFTSVKDFLYNASTGNLSNEQRKDIQDKLRSDIERAMKGADPAVIKQRQEEAVAEVNNFLTRIDASPEQAGLRVPLLGSIGLGDVGTFAQVAVVGAIGIGALYVLAHLTAVRNQFR